MSSVKDVCIVVLCGLPGSGKTSLSLEIKKWLEESDEVIPLVISYDKLMPPSVESGLINQQCEEKSKWKLYREAIVDCVQNLITYVNSGPNLGSTQSVKKWVTQNVSKESIDCDKYSDFNCDFHQILMGQFSNLIHEQISEVKEEKSDELKEDNMKFVIIIDDNMYFRSMRYQYYQLARNSSVGFCEVYVACKINLALQRNSQRSSGFVEPEIISNMATKFEIPNQSHQSWEKYSFICTKENIQIHRKEILDLIKTALQNPVKPLEEIDPEAIAESQRIGSANAVHQADLILRQLISETMIRRKDRKESKAELKKVGKQLADGKSKILHDFREGQITITNTQDEINNSSKDKNNPFFLLVKHKFDELFS